MVGKRVFVSHAANDKPLADAFVDLLQTGGGVDSKDVFCTSLEGLGVPSGEDFISYIRREIQKPEVVILLLSPNYFASQFCLAELGASWAMSHRALPLLVPPLQYSDVKGVLLSTQVDLLDSENDLDRFFENFTQALKVGPSVARWGVKKKQFLLKLPSILAALKKPAIVSVSEHTKLRKKCEDCMQALEEYEAENGTLKNLIAELEKCKDATQVAETKRKHMKGYDALVAELEGFSHVASRLPDVVMHVMFKEWIGETAKFDSYSQREANDDAGSASEDGYLNYDDGFSLNHEDPTVKKTWKALSKLSTYIKKSVDEQVEEAFEEEYEYQLDLNNRRLWKDHFCSRLAAYG